MFLPTSSFHTASTWKQPSNTRIFCTEYLLYLQNLRTWFSGIQFTSFEKWFGIYSKELVFEWFETKLHYRLTHTDIQTTCLISVFIFLKKLWQKSIKSLTTLSGYEVMMKLHEHSDRSISDYTHSWTYLLGPRFLAMHLKERKYNMWIVLNKIWNTHASYSYIFLTLTLSI